MKKLALMVSVLLVAGLASAAQTAAPAQPAPVQPTKDAAVKTHVVEAEVVSADATAKTLTIKGEKENKTVAVDTSAVGSLKSLKSGDKVKLTCRDDGMGAHQAVTEIKLQKEKTQ